MDRDHRLIRATTSPRQPPASSLTPIPDHTSAATADLPTTPDHNQHPHPAYPTQPKIKPIKTPFDTSHLGDAR
jgi:hypothetical protein